VPAVNHESNPCVFRADGRDWRIAHTVHPHGWMFGIPMLAGGLKHLWYCTDFRGLKQKSPDASPDLKHRITQTDYALRIPVLIVLSFSS
jgi:hypothetical protein